MKKVSLFLIWLFVVSSFHAQTTPISRDSVKKLLTKSFKDANDKKFDQAFRQLTDVISYAKEYKNDSLLGAAYNGMGVAYGNLGNTAKRKEYYQLALKSLNKAGYQSYTIYIYNNLANIYLEEGQIEKGIENYKLSIKMAKETNDVYKQYWPTANLGELYYKNKEYDKAFKLISEGKKLFQPNREHQLTMLMDANVMLGDISFIKGDYQKALSYLEEAEVEGMELSYFDGLIRLEDVRYRLFSKTKDIKAKENALLRSVKYLKKKNEIGAAFSQERIKIERELVEKEASLKVTLQQNQEQARRLRNTRYFMLLIIAMLLIGFVLYYLLYRTNKSRLRLNKDLGKKNKELIEAKEKAEYASQIKANFFATISHELRTPLYAVTGISNILLKESRSQEQKKYLQTLKNSGDYLLGLINNVLQINKMDSEKEVVNELDFSLPSLVEDVTESLKHISKQNYNNILVSIDPDLPSHYKGDSIKLTQVLMNLLANALKFTKNGKVWLSISEAEGSNESNTITLLISVKDNGIGIAKDIQEHIFEDFSQESMTLDRIYEGTGLGLSIVKRLLTAMGSEIFVESEPGEGAKFFFKLPLKVVETSNKKSVNGGDEILEGTNVLVVDDNKVNRLITSKVLESKKAKVTLADSGITALEEIRKSNFDIILMDIHMPRMNGYEATRKIREFNTDIPVIALTAASLEDENEKIVASGMNGIIVKPFSLESLNAAISKFV